jgi:hypothetical protein
MWDEAMIAKLLKALGYLQENSTPEAVDFMNDDALWQLYFDCTGLESEPEKDSLVVLSNRFVGRYYGTRQNDDETFTSVVGVIGQGLLKLDPSDILAVKVF